MRRNFKKSIAGALAGLMVLGSLQPLNAQAMEIDSSMINDFISGDYVVESDEATDRVITNNVLTNFNTSFEGADGEGKLYWWNDLSWSPSLLTPYGEMAKPSDDCGDNYMLTTGGCQFGNADLASIITSGSTYEYTYYAKLADAEASGDLDLVITGATSDWSATAAATVTPDEDVTLSGDWQKVTGTFTLADSKDQVQVKFQGAADVQYCIDDFRVGLIAAGGSGEITYGDNIIVNPYFADADVTAWNSAQGESVITAETAGEAIFDDVTTYGKIARDPASSGTGDAFVQDISENVEYGAEYTVEFYAMLSDEYAGAPENQRVVEFAPFIKPAEGDTRYLGASYSSELSGTLSQTLEPGVWTKYEGAFKIDATEGDQVVIRIIEQGTNYGQGDCVKGDYCITGVSMKKINKPKPEIEKDIPNWKDSITKGLGGNTIAGTCFGVGSLTDEALMELSTKHFNAISFENELKPDSLLTSSPKLNGATFAASNGMTIDVPDLTYTNPNKMLDFVKKWNEDNDGNIKIRGHVLVWHSQTPEWFFHENYDAEADYVDKDEMDARLEWYIKTVLEYYTKAGSEYEGMFYGWDVVNEAMSDGTGKPRKASDNSNWARIYGDESNEYIIKAFRFANQYAPAELELYYNDYNDSVPLKCAGITQLLKDIKAAEGTRIDAMGMQSHHGMSDPTISQIEAAVRSYAGVVGAVQLTELDLKASNTYDGTDKTRGDEYTKQAYRYKEIFDLLVNLDAEDDIEVTGITVWGTIDPLSWLQSSNSVGGASQGGNQCPLLFDGDYKAKPAFWAFVDATKLEPNIQKVVAVEKTDDSYAQGKEYNMDKATFVPMWDKDGLKILFNVQDANVDETDAITVYVDPAMTKAEVTPVKVEAKRADATATDGGYKAEVTVPLNNAAVAAKVGFDVVITDGNDKVVFNDLKSLYETNSKYYAELVMKPYATIAKTSAAITIDGEADAAWNNVNAIPLSINLGSQVEANAKLLWDATNLYVYAEVKDAVLDATSSAVHEKDSLEVFIDENNAKTESYEADDKQYRVNYLNEQTFNGTKCNADNIQSKVKLTDTGYVVEAAYKWTDITPAVGTEIGLELQINDAQNGARIGTLSWYDESGQGWTSTAVYGTVKLVAGKKEVVDKVFDFEDVDIIEGNWKYEAVKYVYNRDIMGKVGASNQFQPDNTLTRAMFATVLYRVAGEPEVEFVEKFPDVAAGKWYSEAIIWANKNGIVNGYSTGDYGVNDNITREQIAKMLYEYAQNVAGYDVSGKADIEKFTDCGDVSGWAVDYIKWAADAEMITGKPNGDGTFRIDPKGQATRAECAKMIQKFLEKYE